MAPLVDDEDFKILGDVPAVVMTSPSRLEGHLAGLFSQTVSDERTLKQRARTAASLFSTDDAAVPPGMYKVLSGKRVTLDPLYKNDRSPALAYTSQGAFLSSWEALSKSKDPLAGVRRAALLRPFASTANANSVGSEYLPSDEHCYLRYSGEDALHLFRCFGSANDDVQPDAVNIMGYAALSGLERVVESPATLDVDALSAALSKLKKGDALVDASGKRVVATDAMLQHPLTGPVWTYPASWPASHRLDAKQRPVVLTSASPRALLALLTPSVDAFPTDATSLEDLGAWLLRCGKSRLTAADEAVLQTVLRANVDAAIKAAEAKVGDAARPRRVPGTYGPFFRRFAAVAPDFPLEAAYERLAKLVRGPDQGRLYLLSEVRERILGLPPPPKGLATALQSTQAALDKVPPPPSPPPQAKADTDDSGPRNLQGLYVASDAGQYADGAIVTLRQYGRTTTYRLSKDVWVPEFPAPALDVDIGERAAMAATVAALRARVDGDKSKSGNIARLDRDLEAAQSWKGNDDSVPRPLEVYESKAPPKVAGFYLAPTEDPDADQFTTADNPLFYKADDPFDWDGVADTLVPQESDDHLETLHRIVRATNLELTAEGMQWMRDNLEFYNSAAVFRRGLQRELSKLSGTQEALERSAGWASASKEKQRVLVGRIRTMMAEKSASARMEFRSKSLLVAGALQALLLVTSSPLLDGSPLSLNPLCTIPTDGDTLRKAVGYVVCCLHTSGSSSGETKERVQQGVDGYVDMALKDKPDMAAAVATAVSPKSPPPAWTIPIVVVDTKQTPAAAKPALAPPPTRSPPPPPLPPPPSGIVRPVASDYQHPADLTTAMDDGIAVEIPVGKLVDLPPPPLQDDDGTKRASPLVSALVQGRLDEATLSTTRRRVCDAVVSRLVTDFGIGDAERLPHILEAASTELLASFVRSELTTALSRAARDHRAGSTVDSKVYVDRAMREAIDAAVTGDLGVLAAVGALGGESAASLRGRCEAVLEAALFPVDAWIAMSDEEQQIMCGLTISGVLLAVCNIPTSKGGAFTVADMVDVARAAEDSGRLRAFQVALCTQVITRLSRQYKRDTVDKAMLTATKSAARELQNKVTRETYEAMEEDQQGDFKAFKKVNYKEWKRLVQEATDNMRRQAGAEGGEETAPTAADAQEEEADEEEDVNADEVEDDAVTDGFVRNDD